MLKEIINDIFPIIINLAISILGIVITVLGTYIINFIKLKNSQIIKYIGMNQYNHDKRVALDIWSIVDEHFRINELVGSITDNKIKMFNDEIKKKCPYLSQQEIDFFRQTIAGEINNFNNKLKIDN